MEYVKWKKYERLTQEQQGWINKNELKFEEKYKEVETVGFNVSENDTWLTLAYSLCENAYLYTIHICRADIIGRYKLSKQVIEVKQEPIIEQVSLTEEQEEYVKKDIKTAPSIVEAVEKSENTEEIPLVLYFKNHSYVSVKDFEKFTNIKIESKKHYDNILNNCNNWIDKYEKSDPITFYKEEYENKQEYEKDMKFAERFHIVKPKFIFWDKTNTPIETTYMIKGQKVNAWFLPVGFYKDLKYPEQRKQKQELLDKFVQDYELYTQKELFEIYKESLDSVEIIRMIHYLIDQGLLEEHGKHWRTKKGLIVRKNKSTKSGRLTKEQEQFIVDNYEKYTQMEFAEYFQVKKPVVGESINKLVKKGIVPRHVRGWTRYSEEYKKFRGIQPNKLENGAVTEEQENSIIQYYNKSLSANTISEKIGLPLAKVYEIIRSLVKQEKVLPRAYHLDQYIYYTDEEDLKRKREEINQKRFEKTTVTDIYIDVIPDYVTGGRIKLQPSLNKTQFKQDMKTMSEQELATKYERNSYVIKALINYFSGNEKTIKTIKFLVDKQTGYKWVFHTPLIIENYLYDKRSMNTPDLKLKYGLSGKVFMMLNTYLKEKGFVC